jgi:hypothetical protein
MDKNTVQKLIVTKSDRVVYETYEGKSAVWKSFLLVTVDGNKLPFVKCNRCDTVLKWKSKDGTSSLSGHLDSCTAKGASASNVKITDMPGFSVTSSQPKVPAAVKSQMAAKIVRMCATDIRPFSVVQGQGFKAVAQKLISIGAQYGCVNVDEILPCSTTVSRHLQSVVTASKSELCEKLRSAMNVGITTDGWTHTMTSQQYITTTVHFIDSNWNMHSHILATRLAYEKHTADYIKRFVGGILEEFGIKKEGNLFVTDNASNMKAAFREEIWVGCTGHNLNLVLSHGLQASKENDSLPSEVTTVINTCKELVTLSKRTAINQKLDTTLKQCVCTRWNSVLIMLKSVNDNSTDLRAIAADPQVNRNLLRLLSDLNTDVLQQVIAVLAPFETATKVLSAEKTPTLHLVLPTQYKLRNHLTSLGTDSAIVTQMKQHLSVQLQKYFTVTDIHAAATLLDPRLKNKEGLLSDEVKDRGIRTIRNMVTNTTPPPSVSDDLEPPRKKALVNAATTAASDDFFDDLFTMSHSSASVPDEVQAYLTATGDVITDLLQYWKGKELIWPKLSNVARVLLGVPATSTSSERTFSLAGRTLEERRSTLTEDSVDGLLFLHGLQ